MLHVLGRDEVWYCLSSTVDGIIQCFHCICLDPVEPGKIYNLWVHIFLRGTVYLFMTLFKGYLLIAYFGQRTTGQLPKLTVQMSQLNMAPTFSIRKIKTEHVNKYLQYQFKAISISIKIKNQT